jgi:hypothetical protein
MCSGSSNGKMIVSEIIFNPKSEWNDCGVEIDQLFSFECHQVGVNCIRGVKMGDDCYGITSVGDDQCLYLNVVQLVDEKLQKSWFGEIESKKVKGIAHNASVTGANFFKLKIQPWILSTNTYSLVVQIKD